MEYILSSQQTCQMRHHDSQLPSSRRADPGATLQMVSTAMSEGLTSAPPRGRLTLWYAFHLHYYPGTLSSRANPSQKPPTNSPQAGIQPPLTHTNTRKIKTSQLVFNKRMERTARTYKKGWEEDYMGKMAKEASSIAKANARREGQAKPFSRIPRPARTRSTNAQKCA